MPRGLLLIVNALFPGSMLVLQGSAVAGSLILALSCMGITVVVIGPVIAQPGLRTAGAAAYLLLMAAASALLWWRLRRPALDGRAMRRLHALAASAWLRDDGPGARSAALDLVRLGPAEAGAWRLLALVAGDPTLAAEALRRAEQLASVEG